EAPLQLLIVRQLALESRATGALRDREDRLERQFDLVEERGALEDLEHLAGREERVPLGAAELDRPAPLARLQAPQVRGPGRGRHRLDVGRDAELREVPAGGALRHARALGDLREREA